MLSLPILQLALFLLTSFLCVGMFLLSVPLATSSQLKLCHSKEQKRQKNVHFEQAGNLVGKVIACSLPLCHAVWCALWLLVQGSYG